MKRRTRSVTVRISEDEYQELLRSSNAAAAASISEYARAHLFSEHRRPSYECEMHLLSLHAELKLLNRTLALYKVPDPDSKGIETHEGPQSIFTRKKEL